MKVHAVVVSKSVPEWAAGQAAQLNDGRFVLLLREKPTHVYPRWYHRMGKRLRWRWLEWLGERM